MNISPGWAILREATRSRFKPRISHLILHVTNVCNFRCNHCFIDFQKSPDDLTIEEIRTIANDIPPLIWLDIGGGEPFLRNDLHEILTFFDAKEFSIPTNGWFTQKILDQLQNIERSQGLNKLILTMSIDGLPETHDLIRKRKHSYKKLRHTYDEVRRNFPSLRIKVNSVLCQENYPAFLEFMDYVYNELRPDYHGIQFLRGDPINKTYELPNVNELAAIEVQIREKQDLYDYGRKGILSRVARNYQSLKREVSSDIIRTESQTIHCYGGQVHLVIYPDGKVAPCEMLPAVGSIRSQSLKAILESEKWSQTVSSIIQRHCHCTHDCNMMENILFDFKNYPRLLLGKS